MFYVLAVCCALGILLDNGQLVFTKPATTYDQRQTGDVNVQIHLNDVQVIALLDSELLEDYTDYDYAYDYADFTLKPIVKPTTSSPSVSTSSVKPWNTWPTKPSTSSSSASSPLPSSSSASSSSASSPLPSSSLDSSPLPSSSSTSLSSTSPSSTSVTNQLVVESTTTSINTDDSPGTIDKSKADNGTAIKTRINDKSGNQLFNTNDTTKFEAKHVEEENSISSERSEANLRMPCRSGYVLNKKGRCRSIQKRRRIALVPWTLSLGSKVSETKKFNMRKDLPIRVYKSEPLNQ